MEIPKSLKMGLWAFIIFGTLLLSYATLTIKQAVDTGVIDCVTYKPFIEEVRNCSEKGGTPNYYCINNSWAAGWTNPPS